jgi:hypothetical protein
MHRSIRHATALAVLGAALAAGGAHAVLHVAEIHRQQPSFDGRGGPVAPSAAALAAAAALGGEARWNRFGTLQTLFHADGVLDAGLAGDPAAAGRQWIADHAALFGLSADGVAALELVRDSNLQGSSARVLLFGQTLGGLPVGSEGRIKLGIVDGKLFWVAASSIGEPALAGAATLSAPQALLAAALDLGLPVSLGAIGAPAADGDWQAMTVAGLSHPGRARLVALGIPGGDAVVAWETLTIDLAGGKLTGFTHFVDAANGEILVARNRVAQLAEEDPAQPAEATAFSGSYPPGQVGQCGPCHGPFTASEAADWDRLAVVVHHLAGGDITFNLYRDSPTCSTNRIHSQDLLTTPENVVIEPVVAGNYYVSVCPFDADTNAVVGEYAGAVAFQKNVGPNQNPKWTYFPASPPLDFSSADTRALGCWFDTEVDGTPVPGCDRELAAGSSHGIAWDFLPTAGVASQTTTGNAARSSEAWGAFLSAGGPYQPAVVSTDLADQRVYDFPWTNQWFNSKCDRTVVAHTGGLAADNDIDAAIANLFVLHNQVHDWAYHLGYRERQGAAQLSNFGQTSAAEEHDFELGNAQAGAQSGGWPSYEGRDNANQLPTPDGVPPLSNMYLWQTIGGAIYVPCVDGDFDAGVIAHEYGHLIQHRMVDPMNGLGGDIGGAMGESWSDLTAIGILNEYSRVPVANENPFGVGTYITDPQKGIRNYAMNSSPLNLSNIGYDFTCSTSTVDGTCLNVTQVHSDGEIWSAVNFDIRQALVARHDAAYPSADRTLQARCADGEIPSDRCPGNRRWSQLMHDAFLLMPGAPSMIDARDAYLAADRARSLDPLLSWPSNENELWLAFARRGFGSQASAVDGDDYDPIAGFASPRHANAEITFQLVSQQGPSGTPIVGEVYVGHYEARSTPVADTDPATPLGNGHLFAPGTYELVARANGYGHFRFSLTLAAGQRATATVTMPANWASAAQGATAAGAGADHAKLIDDTESTNWERLGAVPSVDLERPAVTVTLGGVRAINRVQVSGMLEVFLGAELEGRFSPLQGFRVSACNASLLNCTLPVSYSVILDAPDAFPVSRLRALVSDVALKSFATTPVQATHLKFEVLHNKCTGVPGYQGYLGIAGNEDADPQNGTDCRTGSPPLVGPKNLDVRAAELQAFGGNGKVQLKRR